MGQVRLSEVVGGLSYALDLTEGEPAGHAVRSCLIGMRLADVLGLPGRDDLFYALLLKDAGCSANSAHMSALFGADDHRAKYASKRIDWARPGPAFLWAVRTAAPRRALVRRLLAVREEGEVTRHLMQARCERGAQIARMLGLSELTAGAIYALDEHWDGGGYPDGLRGEAIPLFGRILCLAQTVEIFRARGGVEAALRVARTRRGTWFDPALVDALEDVEWSAADLREFAPADRPLTVDGLDAVTDVFAAVIDAKSPWTYRHSDRTSVIATSLAAALDADPATLRDLNRAARLHDIGKLGISNTILDKPAALTRSERATVETHPAITGSILERVPGLRKIAPLAAAHHERLDGSGYPNGWTAGELTMPMRVLAVADVYDALTSPRPYRRALSSEETLGILAAEAPRRLDPDAVRALESMRAGAPAR
jgi:HD-GYP domain-containing protein (c-di-GMP phosphodiesterase class II)